MATRLDPGRLRCLLTLERAIGAPDGHGGQAEAWEEVATLFALVEPTSSRTSFGADQAIVTASHRITTRFRDDLEPGMRFSTGGRSMLIQTVSDPDETRRYLVCTTMEAKP